MFFLCPGENDDIIQVDKGICQIKLFVYCEDFSDILTCQNPDFKSIVEKNRALTMDSMISCIWCRG